MNRQKLSSAITRIELFRATLVREKDDDPRAYEYIAAQSMALKRAVVLLQAEVGEAIESSKTERLKYQKLHASLTSMLQTLDYDHLPCKDECYIRDILEKLRAVAGDVEVLVEYREAG